MDPERQQKENPTVIAIMPGSQRGLNYHLASSPRFFSPERSIWEHCSHAGYYQDRQRL